jgi:integrase
MRGKGEGSVFKDARGYWTARIELPSPDGKRRRKTIRDRDKATVLRKLSEATEQLRKRGDLPSADQSIEQWFTYWLTLVEKDVRPNTMSNYRTIATKYVIPVIGKVRLNKVVPATLRKVTDHMIDDLGLSSTYALNAHRIMSAAFETCMREGRIDRNPAKLMNAPRKNAVELVALDLPEGIQVLKHVTGIPNGARWATALLTGARRGEVLGLELDRVTDVLDLSWQLQRLIWKHGCPDAGACIGKRGADCPYRRVKVPHDYEYRHLVDGLYLTRPKSKAGWRIIPLVDPLRSIIERHIAEAEPNRWGLVFTERDRPIDPDQDTRNWRTVLAETGVEKDVRLHDLRHTAVDMLYLAGVPEDIITDIVGHSSRAMTRDYRSPHNRARLLSGMERMALLFTQQTDAAAGTRELDAS